jgi:hypothetical protein
LLAHCVIEFLALVYCARLHEDKFPNVAIQVLKRMPTHKAVVVRCMLFRPGIVDFDRLAGTCGKHGNGKVVTAGV